MKRRDFLRAAAALALAPAFVRRAFADESCPLPQLPKSPEGARTPTVATAFDRAQRAGRPLLVFVIPADDGKKWDRGAAFGELLNHGSEAQISPLAGLDVVCATMADLRQLVPGAGDGEPLMVFVDRGEVKRLDAKLPQYDRGWRRGGEDYKKMIAEEDKLADRRIQILADLIGQVGPVDRTRGADVRARLTKKRVPGSHWADASGCGTHVEDDGEQLMPACGMGHVPSKSSRFLYLYAQTPGEQLRAERAKMKK
jgi:hypothetical protein